MENILFINACVRKESRTLELAKTVLAQLEGNVAELHLEEENIQPLTGKTLAQRSDCLAKGDGSLPMLQYAKQFAQADTIVIAAPYWDLSFPASLKAYLEVVNSLGITFHYVADNEPRGLCKAKKLIYVMTAGGKIFANHGFEYVRSLAEIFYEIPECICFSAENLDVVGADVERILEKTKQQIILQMKTL